MLRWVAGFPPNWFRLNDDCIECPNPQKCGSALFLGPINRTTIKEKIPMENAQERPDPKTKDDKCIPNLEEIVPDKKIEE
uniref:Uncharacterized protein n=1 Tax=Romanomermis culicivorax TaxID=13658 RepID=A0A915K191_ROMCU